MAQISARSPAPAISRRAILDGSMNINDRHNNGTTAAAAVDAFIFISPIHSQLSKPYQRQPPFTIVSTEAMGKSKSSPATKKAPKKADKKARKSSVVPANIARDARQLIETMAQSENVAHVLSDLLIKLDGTVPGRIISQIEVVQQAASNVYRKGRTAATKICKLPLAVKAYDTAKAAEARRREAMGVEELKPIGKLRAFNKSCEDRKSAKSNDTNRTNTSAGKENRSSPRTSKGAAATTSKGAAAKEIPFTGSPPEGKKMWSKSDIITALGPYRGKRRKEMISAMLKKGKSGYQCDSGIYLLLKNAENGQRPRSRGRPRKFEVQSIVDIAQAMSAQSPGRAVKLEDIKTGLKDKRAEALMAVGVSPGSVGGNEVSDRSAKIGALAAAMMDSFDLGLSDKKIQTQTETRYIASNSIRSMMAYAATALATQFLPGNAPRKGYELFDESKLSEDALYTMKQVAEAYGVESVFPVNPNLVMSTDDTTVFVFSGTSEDGSDWSWKFLSPSEDSGHLSDFEVGSDAEHSGGLRVRLTFTFTATGLMAPPYVAVTGLTEEELPAEACPDGILVQEMPGLCKGGSNDVFAEGSGWLVLLRADKKADRASQEAEAMSIGNKKFAQYHRDVLMPFVRKVREKLGWKVGQAVPECLTAVSWFDGDIPQLQTMLYEAREAMDRIEKIRINKHSSAATGVQQPCDLSPIFRLLKAVQRRTTAEGDAACGLQQTVTEIFASLKEDHGVALALRKKRALIDFLCCLPSLLDKVATKENIKFGFQKAGMIDETGFVPVYEKLVATCRRVRSLELEAHLKAKLQVLLKLQLEHGQVSYAEMAAHGLPPDYDSAGIEVTRVRLAGAGGEHLQPAKQVNHAWQKKLRDDKRRKEAKESYQKAVVYFNEIGEILKRNTKVEDKLKLKCREVANANVATFMQLSMKELKDFVHARKFTGNQFQSSSLIGHGKKLNKLLFKGQTAAQVEEGCDAENPCLVWLAWSVRSDAPRLKQPVEPALEAFVVIPNPTCVTTYAGGQNRPTPTDCLRNASWVAKMKQLVKGTSAVAIADEVVSTAEQLLVHLDARLNRHVDERVDKSKYNHFTLKFVSHNLPMMSALVALCGHVTDDLESEDVDSCLLRLPADGVYQVIGGDLNEMEGCYLYYDQKKGRWIRSGKTSGAAGASFEVRGGQHLTNAQKIDEMRGLEFYRKYPARGVPNLGGRKGYFDNLVMYCAMAFNRTDDLSEFCPKEADEAYFVWSQGTIAELIKRSSPLEHLQLDMIAYLWELVYDLMLGKDDNVSQSPGFEALGLRVNESGSKRKRTQG